MAEDESTSYERFRLLVIADGTVSVKEYQSLTVVMAEYRTTVIGLLQQYGHAKRPKPRARYLQDAEAAFIAVYAPNWHEMMGTRIYPWDCGDDRGR
jgi:hypothetical protein